MAWFLASPFLHFPQEREGPGAEEVVLLHLAPLLGVCWTAAANWAGKLVSVLSVTGGLAVQLVYDGRRDGDKGQEAQQCVVAAQECAGLGKEWMSSHAAPSHSMSWW